jgi:hypothetical protein
MGVNRDFEASAFNLQVGDFESRDEIMVTRLVAQGAALRMLRLQRTPT